MRYAGRPSPHEQPHPAIIDGAAFGAAQRQQVSGPGLRAFLAIAEQWRMGEEDRLRTLGLPARSTYHNWAAKVRAGEAITLPLDTLLRISAVLGIHKALRILFADPQQGLNWLRSPNGGLAFGGQAPYGLITGGTQDGILIVRRHLDAWRGGLFAAPAAGIDELPPLSDDDIIFI